MGDIKIERAQSCEAMGTLVAKKMQKGYRILAVTQEHPHSYGGRSGESSSRSTLKRRAPSRWAFKPGYLVVYECGPDDSMVLLKEIRKDLESIKKEMSIPV